MTEFFPSKSLDEMPAVYCIHPCLPAPSTMPDPYFLLNNCGMT